jgi:hypothetical protein
MKSSFEADMCSDKVSYFSLVIKEIMSDAVINILTDKDYAKNIADNGRKGAQHFITEDKVREYEKLFSQNY